MVNPQQLLSTVIYAAVGVDARIAGACRRKEMQAAGGGMPGAGGMPGGGGTQGGASRGAGAAAPGSALTIGGAAEVAPTGMRRTRSGLVFVKKGDTFEPRLVQLGASNFDYTEIVNGLKEGEQVALLAAASLQAQRQLQNDRMKAHVTNIHAAVISGHQQIVIVKINGKLSTANTNGGHRRF